jgi:hypothetical protein
MPGKKVIFRIGKRGDFSIKNKEVTNSGGVSMQSVEQRTNVYKSGWGRIEVEFAESAPLPVQ